MRLLAVLAVVAALACPAVAEPEGERLFKEGQRLTAAGKLADACEAFEASERIEAKPSTLLNLGDCQERRGFTATAHATFVEAKALAEAQHDARREAEAQRRLDTLAPRIARMTIVVTRDRVVDGMTIRRNGVSVDPAAWNSAVALDPGEYTLEVSAPGHTPWTKRLMLGAKEQATVIVGQLAVDATVGSTQAVVDSRVVIAKAASVPLVMRSVAVGAIFGVNIQHEGLVTGLRVSAAMVAPGGQLRGIGSGFISPSYADEPMNDSYRTTTYSFSLAAQYLWQPQSNLGVGASLGVGADYDVVTPMIAPTRINDLGGFAVFGVSPIVLRLRQETLEAGVHINLVVAGDEVTVNGVVGFDWFVW